MMQLIFKLFLLVLAFRLVRAILRRSRRSRAKRFAGTQTEKHTNPDYTELSPYEIEDADYEELPKEKE